MRKWIKNRRYTSEPPKRCFFQMMAALALTVAAAGPVTAATGSDLPARIDSEIRRALAFLHHEQFDSALAVGRKLQRMAPDDPAGYLMAANVYQTMMRDYRVRLFEKEFTENLEKALELASAKVRQHPGSSRYFFALGTVRGYQAVHRFRKGRWLSSVHSGYLSLRYFKQALAAEPEFVDPLLALALYEFWKSRLLHFGPWTANRDRALEQIHLVWRKGRYLSNDAAYSLQTLYYLLGEYDRALEINDWIFARYPSNPICLYHRALILEALGRDAEALKIWERLVQRIEAFIQPSMGFLAECHLHRALILERLSSHGDTALQKELYEAIELAKDYAERRNPAQELEGPFILFKEIRKRISLLQKKHLFTKLRGL